MKSKIEQITDLAELKAKGVLTEAEFETLKQEVISGASQSNGSETAEPDVAEPAKGPKSSNEMEGPGRRFQAFVDEMMLEPSLNNGGEFLKFGFILIGAIVVLNLIEILPLQSQLQRYAGNYSASETLYNLYNLLHGISIVPLGILGLIVGAGFMFVQACAYSIPASALSKATWTFYDRRMLGVVLVANLPGALVMALFRLLIRFESGSWVGESSEAITLFMTCSGLIQVPIWFGLIVYGIYRIGQVTILKAILSAVLGTILYLIAAGLISFGFQTFLSTF